MHLQEAVKTGVENLTQPRAFSVNRNGSASNRMIKHACLDVGELCAKVAPHFAIVIGYHIRVFSTLVPLCLVRIKPNCIDFAIQQHG